MEKSSEDVLKELAEFITESPTAFHATAGFATRLEEAGFTELDEREMWRLENGGRYFCRRNDSSIIAFVMPSSNANGFNIVAAHTDSPGFKIKDAPERNDSGYSRLDVEEYGGALHYPWFDRPLSIAGRVFSEGYGPGDVKGTLVDFQEPVALFPSLAIHMNRDANKGRAFDAVNELCPVIGLVREEDAGKSPFREVLAKQVGCAPEQILSADLFCYPVPLPAFRGLHGELFGASRLDDLACAYPAFVGFLESLRSGSVTDNAKVAVFAAFDNEEVGSRTRQGANSTFLESILRRIIPEEQELMLALANSFLLSADNAHAIHPGHPSKCDIGNQPKPNGGIVLKYAANQTYCTDAKSAAIVKTLGKMGDVPIQVFTNRNGQPGGSTLGNILLSHVSIDGADIGLAQLAMHSPYEMMGAEDPGHLAKFVETFFGTNWKKS